jgi:steroid delta-isomerase-like uncharacterized protein
MDGRFNPLFGRFHPIGAAVFLTRLFIMSTALSSDRNKQLVERIGEEMFNHGKLEVAHEIFGTEFVDRGHEQVGDKKDGPEGFARFVKMIRSALPDLHASIQKMVAEGDHVAMWNTATATQTGDLFGIPASGKKISMKDFHFFRFSEGKVVEHWNQLNVLETMQQLGVVK